MNEREDYDDWGEPASGRDVGFVVVGCAMAAALVWLAFCGAYSMIYPETAAVRAWDEAPRPPKDEPPRDWEPF